jgi:hypothetical protein
MIKRLKTRKELIKALIDYHKRYYTDGGFPTIFSLQQKMIEIGICPRCGKRSNFFSSISGHFPCWECGFKLSPGESYKIFDDDLSIKSRKRILKKRLGGRKDESHRL